MAAKESRLALLHEKLADRFIAMLEKPEELRAADLTAIAKFLKDNNITCEADMSPKLKELRERAASNVVNFPFDPAKEA